MLISLRIPDDLLAEIDAEALADDRSRNSVLLRRIRGSNDGKTSSKTDAPAMESKDKLPAMQSVRSWAHKQPAATHPDGDVRSNPKASGVLSHNPKTCEQQELKHSIWDDIDSIRKSK